MFSISSGGGSGGNDGRGTGGNDGRGSVGNDGSGESRSPYGSRRGRLVLGSLLMDLRQTTITAAIAAMLSVYKTSAYRSLHRITILLLPSGQSSFDMSEL